MFIAEQVLKAYAAVWSETDRARFAVAVVDPEGKAVAEGEDIIEFSSSGRIARVLTFWGALPPPSDSWPPELLATERQLRKLPPSRK